MEAKEEVKGLILEQSEKRFTHYGFGKTTMAEIAKDCQMSAANIYRYFESKEDIGVCIAEQCIEKKEKIIRDIIHIPGLSASQILENIIVEEVRYNVGELCNRPKIIEIIEYVSQHRKDIVQNLIERKKSLIAEVLARGNASGEFEVDDIVATADTFLKATMRFWVVPLFFIFSDPIDKLEQQAKDVAKLLINGLAKR